MGGILAAWIVELGIITYRDFTGKAQTAQGLPLPADFLATFLFYGGLGFIPASNPGAHKFALSLAWAFTGASFLNLFDASNPLAKKTGSSSTTSTAPSKAKPTTTKAA